VDGAWVVASSKLNHYGDDSDEPRWIVENAATGAVTRNVTGPDGDMIATTSINGDVRLQLTNLHSDVAATIDTGLTEPELYDFDEFGVPAADQAQARYGWLGGKQRSAEATGGVVLMGVRLYSPDLGRFLQVDPEDGGNATAYDYCAGDPVNCTDLDGKFGLGSIKRGLAKVATIASYASMIPGPIGTIAGGVAVISYAATGNWKEAAWALAAAGAAVVGAGAAVKGARIGIRLARAAAKARKAKIVARALKWKNRANALNQSAKARFGLRLAKKHGKNRVVIENRRDRYLYDMAGKSHYEKSIGRHIATPHHKDQPRNPRAPSGFGKAGPVRLTGWGGLFRIWWRLWM
jgi:RHS repeat-associated protein